MLGLKPGASAENIRKSYKRLARKYHPDLNPGDGSAEERFKAISEAYDVLGDPKKRKIYDQYGYYSDQIPPDGPAASGPVYAGFDFSGFDFSGADYPGAGGRGDPQRGFGSSFPGYFFAVLYPRLRGAFAPEPRPGREPTLNITWRIGFWDAIRGMKARISVVHEEACPTCFGTGSGTGGPRPLS